MLIKFYIVFYLFVVVVKKYYSIISIHAENYFNPLIADV